MADAKFSFDQVKTACAMYVFHGQREHEFGDQELMQIKNLMCDQEQDPIS